MKSSLIHSVPSDACAGRQQAGGMVPAYAGVADGVAALSSREQAAA